MIAMAEATGHSAELLGAELFTVAGESYRWADVVLAAMWRRETDARVRWRIEP